MSRKSWQVHSGYSAAKFISVEEGTFQNGAWKATSTREPDLTAGNLGFSADGAMVKVKLANDH